MTVQPCAFVHFPGTSVSGRTCGFTPSQEKNAVLRLGRIAASPLSSASMLHGVEPAPVETATVFEPIMPSTESLAGFGIIVVLCIVVYNVWAEQVVPVSRTKLAISKSRGEVKQYLDELKASDQSLVNSTDTEVLVKAAETASDDKTVASSVANTDASNNRSFERWLFTDWILDNKSERKGGRQKEPALPILKDAKWNSGDNPVLAASALLGAGLLFSAVTERVSSMHF